MQKTSMGINYLSMEWRVRYQYWNSEKFIKQVEDIIKMVNVKK